MSHFSVDTDRLTRHASTVDRIGAEVVRAARAADSVHLVGGVFGSMCAFLVAPVVLCHTVAVSSLASAGHMIERTSDQQRVASNSFEAAEGHLECGFRSAHAHISRD